MRCLSLCAVINVILVFVVVGVAVTAGRNVGSAYDSSADAGEEEAPELASGMNGAVAADEPRCSAIGGAVLQEGGGAVDAAVATALCLGILHPYSSGVGGRAVASCPFQLKWQRQLFCPRSETTGSYPWKVVEVR